MTEGKLFYTVQSPQENNEPPVKFESVESTVDRSVFENKLHDFPQTIAYRKISDDSLVSEIAGKIDGSLQSEQFAMKKIR